MKKQNIIPKNLKWVLLACVILVAAGGVAAVNPFEDIEYPVEELGNCQNREECKQFCDNPENMEPCLEFAKRVGLMSDREVEKAKKMATVGKMEGPGGCVGEDACKAYCDQIDNMRECIKFAEENGLIPLEELEEAKRVLRAIDQGITPPNCNGKTECDVYCSQVEHMEECIEFGIASGMMPPEEQVEAKKMLEALKRGVKPLNCNGKEECDVYCNKPENMQECTEFAIEAGFMPPHEAEEAKKMLKALEAGIKPPNCRGDRECDIYCKQPEHMAECMEFSIAAGFAPSEEIEMMKKTLNAIKQGIMPPDCGNDEECRIYCGKEENRQQCTDFSVAAGFMTEEEVEMMEKTGGKGPGGCESDEECRAFCDNIDNARECIQFGVKMGEITQDEADRKIRDMGGTMSSLFDCTTKEECEEFCSNRRNENELMCIQLRMVTGEITQEEAERIMEKEILQKGPGGPGGCRTIKECEEFCKKPGNMEECMRFTTGGRMATVGVQAVPAQIQVGPGGCRTLEECQEFCSKPENEQECMGPQGSDGMIGSGQGEQWTFEDEERIKQALQKEYGDEWQKVYDEKMRQRIEGMPPPGAWEGQQGTEVYMSPQEEEWQQQTKEEYMQRYGDEWEKRYNEEFEGQYLGDLQPERFMGSEGEGEVFRYTPGGVNQIILDVEQGFRDGVSLETELRFKPEGDTGGEWTIEGQTEQFYPQPESQPWPQEPIEGEWQEPKQDEWIDTSDGGASESWGEFEVYKEPIIEGGDWDVVEGDPGQWTDTTSAPMPTVDEPVYNIMPVPTYIEPAPMPTVDEPIYNIMPEPTYNEPAPEPSQGLLQPFRKFLGSVVESLAD